MPVLTRVARGVLTRAYHAGVGTLVRSAICGQMAHREFSRVIIVTALARRNGITRGAELQYSLLRQCGLDVELIDATPALRSPFFRVPHRPGSAYVFHAGGPQTPNLIGSVLPAAARAYRIGYWAWELPTPPLDWTGCDHDLDEIWTPSVFSRDALARHVRRPIVVAPHYVAIRPMRQRTPGSPFTVLTMADSRSSISRKNPEGAFQAFRSAFGDSPSARLLLKIKGDDGERGALKQFLGRLTTASNVEVIAGHLPESSLDAIYQRADVLLSLHRSEGFGLPMREAMARAIPVVATGWSGNLDFMDESSACLVPYRLTPVEDVSGIYNASTWAEPDLDAAAKELCRLAYDGQYYRRVSEAAYLRASNMAPYLPIDGGNVAGLPKEQFVVGCEPHERLRPALPPEAG